MACSEPLVKTRDRGLESWLKSLVGRGNGTIQMCLENIRLLANKNGCGGSDSRWKVLFDLGAPGFY
jgi:hypothetical protein